MAKRVDERTRVSGRLRLLALVALLLVVGIAGTSLFSFSASRQALRASIVENELPVTSDTVYSEIQRDLVRPILISSLMASDTFLRDWVLGGERDPADMVKYLGEVQRKYQAFTSFFVSDRSRIYYQADRILKKVDPAEPRDAWYFRVRGMTAPYEINVDIDLAHADALTVFINYRVLDYEDRFIGAAGVGLEVAAIGELTEEYRRKFGRSVYFLDSWGRIVAGLPGGMESASVDRSALGIGDIEGLAALAPRVLASERGSYAYRRDGRTWLLDVRLVEELGWRLCVEKDEDAALVSLRRALAINLGVCAAITLLILGLTIVTIDRFQAKLEWAATRDGLTGLLSRPALTLLVEQAFKEIRRSGGKFSLVMIDLDHFKDVNDRYGHQVGDAALRLAAAALRSCLRESDLAARWGGEEFLIVLRDCGLEEAEGLAERMRAAVAAAQAAPGVGVTASFGVVERHPEEGFEELSRRADEFLYRAKAEGRNRVSAG